MSVTRAIAGYAQGLFPMDDPSRQDEPIPWYRADPRAVFELDRGSRDALRRRLRRALSRADGWQLAQSRDFEAALRGCMRPRAGDGVWLTERLANQYRALHDVGCAQTFELWQGDTLVAGMIAVVIGHAAMLESMWHDVPDSGNVLLVRTLDDLAERHFRLCDIQLTTPHTLRLGAREIPAAEFERRLAAAVLP